MTTPVGTYGLTPDGWVGKSMDTVQAEVDAALQGILGASSGSNPDGTIPLNTYGGQLKTLICDLIGELWDQLAALAASLDPSQSTGVAQDNLCSLTGVVRDPEDYSTVIETCCGVPGTSLAVGRQVAVGPAGGAPTFTTAVDGATPSVIAQLTEWETDTVEAVGNRVWNNDTGGNPHAWQATDITSSGETASSGAGPVPPPALTLAFNGAAISGLTVGTSLSPTELALAITAIAISGLTASVVSIGSGLGVNIQMSGSSVVGIAGSMALLTLFGLSAGVVNNAATGAAPAGGWTIPNVAAGPGDTVTDNQIAWTYLGDGQGAVDVPMEASVVGPLAAPAGALNTIMTPVFGWATAFNLAAAEVGALQETDTALRVRRDAELQSDGLGTVGAIRAAVLAVGQGTNTFVSSCSVFENTGDVTGPDDTGIITGGMPPHSILVLADYDDASANPALDLLIAEAIFAAKGGGIQTTFANAPDESQKTTTITDPMGYTRIIHWARPTAVPIYVAAEVVYNDLTGAAPLPADIELYVAGTSGDETLSNGSVTNGVLPTLINSFPAGKTVRSSALSAAIQYAPTDPTPGSTAIPGILGAQCKIGTSASPTGYAPITMTVFDRATISSVNIAVTPVGSDS